MNSTAERQGYFIGSFLRFLWLTFVSTIFQTMIIYVFGQNIFTYYILSIIISFFINTSFPINNSYPFFRHLLILATLLIAMGFTDRNVTQWLLGIFQPDWIWASLLVASLIFGTISSIGRYGNGTISKSLESWSGIVLFIFIALAFFLYWWKGGIIYLVFRIPLIFIEAMIAQSVLYLISRAAERDVEV